MLKTPPLASVLLALAASLLSVPPVQASSVVIHVTSPADSGPGTLRQAILDGNALPSTDAPDVRVDLLPSQPIKLESSLPTITSTSFTISGTLSRYAVIDGQSNHRILTADAEVLLLQIDNLMLTNGYNPSGHGACVWYQGTGWLAIEDSWFKDCTAYIGEEYLAMGAAVDSSAAITAVSNSHFIGNVAIGGAGAFGAAIAASYEGASLSVHDSEFRENTVMSTATGVYAAAGGAIAGRETTVEASRFIDNAAYAGNGAPSRGGAIYNWPDALEVRSSVFLDNQSQQGGAIYVSLATGSFAMIGNNTFVANRATLHDGGALYAADWAMLELRNNSFWLNSATTAGDNIAGIGSLGAFNNLFARGLGAGDSCSGLTSVAGSDYNIVPASECGIGATGGNVITQELHLRGFRLDGSEPLQFFADSPALGGANPGPVDDSLGTACLEQDANGNPRPADGDADSVARCDIGAFESQHEAPLFAADFEERLNPATP
ncbi:MAG TPA: choice-of-anchor Q domain-containing protein [Rhodanobacteraceae bacterium]|nr:choice-of-anchor Q domain-containing protein [Rhodanobacteraceae bacterium]